jgi:hypothetical protein
MMVGLLGQPSFNIRLMKKYFVLVIFLYQLHLKIDAQVIPFSAQDACEKVDSVFRDIHTLSYKVERIKKSYSSDSIFESEAIVHLLRKNNDTLGYYHHISESSDGYIQMYNGDEVLLVNQADSNSLLFVTKLHGLIAITGSYFSSYLLNPIVKGLLDYNCSKEIENIIYFEVNNLMCSNQPCVELKIGYKDSDEFTNQVDTYIFDLSSYLPLQYSSKYHFLGVLDSTVYRYSEYVLNGSIDSTMFTLEGIVPDHDKLELFQFAKKYENLGNGTIFPTITGVTQAGNPVTLSDFKGRIYILSFWFVGCYPCTKSFKEISNYLNELESEGILLIGVNGVNFFDQFNNYIERMNLGSIHLSVKPNVIEPIKISSYPTIYILNEKMEVLWSLVGWNDEKFLLLKEQINKLTLD